MAERAVAEVAHPDLEAIKPGVKAALNETESQKFDSCILSQYSGNTESLTVEKSDDGRVSCVGHALSSEECTALCQVMDSSAHLSFWNDQGRENEKARQFRDADTVEVNLSFMASTLWDRISVIIDKTPIVISYDDTEHVRLLFTFHGIPSLDDNICSLPPDKSSMGTRASWRVGPLWIESQLFVCPLPSGGALRPSH